MSEREIEALFGRIQALEAAATFALLSMNATRINVAIETFIGLRDQRPIENFARQNGFAETLDQIIDTLEKSRVDR